MRSTRQMIAGIMSFVAMGCAIASAGERPDYDLLSIASQFRPEILNIDVHDKTRQRDIPIRIYPINDKSIEEIMKSRRTVFSAFPPCDKYKLILYKAWYEAFTDCEIFGNKVPRNPNHHRVILAISTAFWDWYLRGDVSAKDWRCSDGGKSVMERDDTWRMKWEQERAQEAGCTR